MLQSIRDNTQGWIAGVIISLLILSFALWGIHSYLGGGGSNSSIAQVNGEDITKSQLNDAYERLHRQLQMQSNSSYQLSEQAEANLKQRALQSLINMQVLKNASLSQGYQISSRQVDNFLAGMTEFQVNGEFSIERFQQLLETTLYNANDFFELIRTSLLIDQPRLGIIFTSFALPNESAETVSLVNQERNIQYMILPLQVVAKQPIQISEDKILAYYKSHQDEFKTPEQVNIDYIELTLNQLMNSIHPTEDTLKSFYNDNNNSYARPKQWSLESVIVPVPANATKVELTTAEKKAGEVFQKANQGEVLNKLVNEFSLQKGDEKSNAWVTLNQVPVEFQKTLSTLTKVGQVAHPIQANKGFVILKVIDIKQAEIQPYDKVKDKIKQDYVRQKAEEQFANMREQLANLTYEHPDSLDSAAKALGLTINTSELFTKENGGKDVTKNNKIREAAFSNDVLSLNNNSDVIQIAGDDAIVLRIKTHKPAALLSLKTVEKQINDKLKIVEIDARAERLATEIKQKLQSGMDPNQVAQQYHLYWNSLGFISRHANKVDSAILETAFAMPRPHDNNKMSYDITKMPNGFAIIGLKDIRAGSAKPEQKQLFSEQVQNTQGLMEYELYKQSLLRGAKIVVSSQ